MTKQEISQILEGLVNDFIDEKIGKGEVVDKLITSINPLEIYNLENELLITDCYFAIKHLGEDGYETTIKELVYFRECFMGIKKYDTEQKNQFILGQI
ncbi:hypothetical protein [Ruminiclostridium cellulolyticum]|uniref:Uncharacterized protein n=1 Tax=Ruminiclostridium cellulolyticum (strain ATCC 35319 / DSM 5812 / JCM 6584 / H10) TaxID=394503 RepID=B8I460_RUMCH|nr:hypothetical protein [Ruminiclostridium cellulolyticum]ACL76493.1 conserved hypothetical protein [Ruminiclostridium cellulolyticum H10]